MARNSAIALVMLVLLGACVWGLDILKDRKFVVAVKAPATLYSLPPHEYPKTNPAVTTLSVGQPLQVLRVRYGKDFEALKVETANGQVGWVIGGEGVSVLSR